MEFTLICNWIVYYNFYNYPTIKLLICMDFFILFMFFIYLVNLYILFLFISSYNIYIYMIQYKYKFIIKNYSNQIKA